MKWSEYKSVITKGYNRKYTPVIKFTKTGLANINTIFSEDKRVVGKKYYQLYTTNQNRKKLLLNLLIKKQKTVED